VINAVVDRNHKRTADTTILHKSTSLLRPPGYGGQAKKKPGRELPLPENNQPGEIPHQPLMLAQAKQNLRVADKPPAVRPPPNRTELILGTNPARMLNN